MTQHVLSLSYGKDSMACLGALEKLGWPIDRIVHAEIWATDTISADLPPMVEFKKKADAIIKERYGIEVEHIYAVRGGSGTPTKSVSTLNSPAENSLGQSRGSLSHAEDGANISSTGAKLTYESIFYRKMKKPRRTGGGGDNRIYGFPMRKGNWCNSDLKIAALRRLRGSQTGSVSIAPGNSSSTLCPTCIF